MEITKKELKEILKEQNDISKRHVEVIMEKFQSEVKLIGEQHSSIKATLDSHTEMFKSIKETLNNHTDEIKSIKEIQGYHTEMIGSIKEDVEITKEDVGFIKDSLRRKADAGEFSALERRVAVLETRSKVRIK